MTFLFSGDHGLIKGKITEAITATLALACVFGIHAETQSDLSMVIDGRLNTVQMPGLECSPNGPVWTNFANFRLLFNR